jgi:hypothetical protein
MRFSHHLADIKAALSPTAGRANLIAPSQNRLWFDYGRRAIFEPPERADGSIGLQRKNWRVIADLDIDHPCGDILIWMGYGYSCTMGFSS